MPAHKIPLEQRFWAKVHKTDGCWIWQAAFSGDGYGTIQIDKRKHRAHRVAYEMTYGAIPDGLWVLHRCDNPSCVRPDHLWLGTHQDNVQDCSNKGRDKLKGARGNANGLRKHPERNPSHLYPEIRRGENSPNAKLTRHQVDEIRSQYNSGAQSIKMLASEHKVSPSTIRAVIKRQNWNH